MRVPSDAIVFGRRPARRRTYPRPSRRLAMCSARVRQHLRMGAAGDIGLLFGDVVLLVWPGKP